MLHKDLFTQIIFLSKVCYIINKYSTNAFKIRITGEMRKKCLSAVLIDDEKVRVTRFDFEPGQETGWHKHDFDYVITAITNCNMMLQNPDGTQSTFQVFAGNAYRRDAGVRHNVINKSDERMSFVEIELKN